MSKSNELTQEIIEYLFYKKIFSWRMNTVGIYDAKRGVYRPAPKKGISDILGCMQPDGRFLAIEVKIGKDRLSPEQTGFLKTINDMGGLALVARTFEEFINDFERATMPPTINT